MTEIGADFEFIAEPVSVAALQDQVAALEACLMMACSFVSVLLEDQPAPVAMEVGDHPIELMPGDDPDGVLTIVTGAVAALLLEEQAELDGGQFVETAHAVDLVRGVAGKVVH
jgi:hypothetical protein